MGEETEEKKEISQKRMFSRDRLHSEWFFPRPAMEIFWLVLR